MQAQNIVRFDSITSTLRAAAALGFGRSHLLARSPVASDDNGVHNGIHSLLPRRDVRQRRLRVRLYPRKHPCALFRQRLSLRVVKVDIDAVRSLEVS